MPDATRYLPPSAPACPTFLDDTEYLPLVDGAAYLPELDRCLQEVRAGDAVFVAGLDMNPHIDLAGRRPGDAGYCALGEQLAAAAASGADVRVLLAGRVIGSSIPWKGLGPFRDNAKRAEELREWRPARLPATADPPLARRVLLDHSGALLGSNHQKAVAVRLRGVLTAFVGGIDLNSDRFDDGSHDSLTLRGERWGWHDCAVRLRGAAASRVHETLRRRWIETTTLPRRRWIHSPTRVPQPLNPAHPAPPPDPEPARAIDTPGVRVQVLRSYPLRKTDSVLPVGRRPWRTLPHGGLQEIFTVLSSAIGAARHYVYIEDQYLSESLGGDPRYELWPHLLAAALRGVKVVLLGSGVRDPDDAGVYLRPINRSLNRDLRRKLIDPLPGSRQRNVAVYRLEHATVHAKLALIDDTFVNIGSANMFARSMSGTDSEMSAAAETTTSLVRDLRVAVWAEHLRTPLTAGVRAALEDVDLALALWRPSWRPPGAPRDIWQRPGSPDGYAPAERALRLVGPS
jgi:phosphatidylserine/phosphatidylglycerophosphate/cardiolipin synthase-like enzyme